MEHGQRPTENFEFGRCATAKSSIKILVHCFGSFRIPVHFSGSFRIPVHFFGSSRIPVHSFGSFRILQYCTCTVYVLHENCGGSGKIRCQVQFYIYIVHLKLYCSTYWSVVLLLILHQTVTCEKEIRFPWTIQLPTDNRQPLRAGPGWTLRYRVVEEPLARAKSSNRRIHRTVSSRKGSCLTNTIIWNARIEVSEMDRRQAGVDWKLSGRRGREKSAGS